MTADLSHRLGELGAVLAQKMPGIVDATLVLLESMSPALDAAGSGRYEIQRQIGLGGHAEVLLGIARGADGFERPVAIKRVRAELADQSRFVTMLAEEAYHAARLSHPNVVSVLDFARDAEGQPYLVMEHVAGIDLGARRDRPLAAFRRDLHRARAARWPGVHPRGTGPRSPPRSRSGPPRRQAEQRAALVGGRREARGLRPGPDGRKMLPASANAGEGTPGYMSPEQAYREELDTRSDLYAVGTVLWELLASWRLRAGPPGDVAAAITFQAIGRPSEHRPVAADLEAVVMRLLAYFREERYPTAELAARDLVSCQDTPRDGRGELVRLLDERFPRARRQGPLSRRKDPATPSTARQTVTGPWLPPDAPHAPSPEEQQDVPCFAGTLDPPRQRGK